MHWLEKYNHIIIETWLHRDYIIKQLKSSSIRTKMNSSFLYPIMYKIFSNGASVLTPLVGHALFYILSLVHSQYDSITGGVHGPGRAEPKHTQAHPNYKQTWPGSSRAEAFQALVRPFIKSGGPSFSITFSFFLYVFKFFIFFFFDISILN